MTNMRRARKVVRANRPAKAALDDLHDAISVPVFDMEEPLREGRHLIHIIAAIAQYRGEDNEAVSTVASEAMRKLDLVEKLLRRLFRILRRAGQRSQLD